MTTSDLDLPWIQGSYLSYEHVHELQDKGSIPAGWRSDDVVIVLSHSCDLVARLAEVVEYVELIRGVRKEAVDGHRINAKHPRRLDMELSLDGPVEPIGFHIHSRVFVRRGEVIGNRTPRGIIDEESRRLLAWWAGKSYWREAFPDVFNDRVGQVDDKLRRVMRRESAVRLSGLYVVLDSYEELAANQDYGVDLIGSMRKEDHENQQVRDAVQEVLNEFEAGLGAATGINIGESTLVAESDITLHDLRTLRRWDYDDLSLRRSDAELPADVALGDE